MKTAILGLAAIFLIVCFSLLSIPGCKKTGELTAVNKTSLSSKTANGDTVASPVVQYITVPLTGDQITLVPHYYKSQTADSSYLYLMAQPKNSYCYTSKLEFTSSLGNNGTYIVGFIDVKEPSPCIAGDSPIFAEINFMQTPGGNLPNGTFPLSVTLNGATYTGSITVTAAAISFTWNYTTGVLIAPAQIAR